MAIITSKNEILELTAKVFNTYFKMPDELQFTVEDGALRTLVLAYDEDIGCIIKAFELKPIKKIDTLKVMEEGLFEYFLVNPSTGNIITQVASDIVSTRRSKNRVIDIDVHFDLETSMFNKIYTDEAGNFKHGAKEGKIFDACMMFTSHQCDIDHKLKSFFNGTNSVRAFISLDKEDSKEQTEDNLLFHCRTGFLKEFSDSDNKMTLSEFEDIVIARIKDICSILDREFKTYSFDNKIIFRLVGKSTFFDMDFAQQQMPKLSRYFSHELKDISSFKNFWREVNPKFFVDITHASHTSLDDVLQTVEQHKNIREFYRAVNELTGGASTLTDANIKLNALIADIKRK